MTIVAKRCNAKTKSSGKPCQRWVVPGMTRCRVHGGASPVGVDSPSFKHGRYSKHLPPQLLNKYRDAQKDKDLLNLNEEIYIIDIRLKSLVEKLPDGGISHSWAELKKIWAEFVTSYNSGDIFTTKKLIQTITQMLDSSASETRTWEDVLSVIEKRRKLVSSEAKRLTDMQQTITAERAMALIYAMLDVVRSNILIYRDNNKLVDNKLLQGISNGIRALVSIPDTVIDSTSIEEDVKSE